MVGVQFIHSFTHSFNKHSSSACYVPGTVPGTEGTLERKTTKFPALVELIFLVVERDNKHNK